MAEADQSFIVFIPSGYTSQERVAIANAIIDHIVDRTRAGLDKNGNPFKGYSKAYIKHPDFRIAGKSANDVNLTYSGEMLVDLVLVAHGDGFVKIGFIDKYSNDKAAWNKTARNGGRDFLGIQAKELNKIIARFGDPTVRQTAVLLSQIEPQLQETLVEGLGKVSGGFEESD